tara:strand:+ start:4573 stop:5040 length:468 start_codon:yes stop_codon:yes gene_type:complete
VKIKLLAVGGRMPDWVSQGFEAFASRMPRELRIELVEIPLAVRGKNSDIERAKNTEGEKLLERSTGDLRVMLDERGKGWTSAQLAAKVEGWKQSGRDVSILVGGPDGHSDAVKASAEQAWSLSNLTLPHALVRVLVAEQLYRAWSLSANHPYHRA